jgi:hypothetical protein
MKRLVFGSMINKICLDKESAALVSILGPSTHLPNPNQALAYRDGFWVSIQEGDEVS